MKQPTFLVRTPDGKEIRKTREQFEPKDELIFDGDGAFASSDAAQERLDAEIEAAGGIERWRTLRAPSS